MAMANSYWKTGEHTYATVDVAEVKRLAPAGRILGVMVTLCKRLVEDHD